jgi:signal transduction histidine kinase
MPAKPPNRATPARILAQLPRWLAADALGREDRWLARAACRLSGSAVLLLEPDSLADVRTASVRAHCGRAAALVAELCTGDPSLLAALAVEPARRTTAQREQLRRLGLRALLRLPLRSDAFGPRLLLLLDAKPRGRAERSAWTVAAELWLREAAARRSAATLRAQTSSATQSLEHLRSRSEREGKMLEELVAHLPTAVLVVAADGTLRVLNRAARRLLGLGQTPLRKLSELEKRVGLAFSLLLSEEATSAPFSQDVIWGEEGARHLRIDVGSIAGGEHVLVLRDVTRRRRLELEQAEFVGSVSHELKTPLTALRTALEIILQGEAGLVSEEQAHFLQMGKRNIDRLSRLIQQLLDIARHESGRLELARERLDLAALLTPHLDSFARHARRERRELSWDLSDAAFAYVDADRCIEILENLLGNALKFTEPGGQISVALRAGEPCPDERVRWLAQALDAPALGALLEVQDDGRGMEPAAAERAFQRFYQEGDPLANRPAGAGLGLAITRALVAAHEGTVGLTSAKGRGTTVRVWLPQDGASAALPATVERLGYELRELSARLRRGRLVRLQEFGPAGELERLWRAQGLDPARLGAAIGQTRFGLVLEEEWRAPLRRALAAAAELGPEAAFPQRGAELGTLLAQLLRQGTLIEAVP